MSYSHFSIEERISIKHLLAKGVSIRQIASELNRSPSSVSREIKRNSHKPSRISGATYTVTMAQVYVRRRKSKAHNIVQFPLEVIQIVEQRIKETWSPEQIAAYYKDDGFPCYKTIYKWINDGTIINGNKKLLRRKGCLTGWIGTAARTRTQFYRFRGREYVLASRTLGASDARLIAKHILPNALGTIITGAVLMIPSVIFSEATISYLGLGLKGMSSLGVILSDNQAELLTSSYLLIFPAIVIALIMISFNLFGNGLRDAINPSLKGEEE